jgi:hypothetical protein
MTGLIENENIRHREKALKAGLQPQGYKKREKPAVTAMKKPKADFRLTT